MPKKSNKTSLPWLISKTKRYLPGVFLLSLINAISSLSFIWLALLSETLINAAAEIMQAPPSPNFADCLRLPQIYIPALQVIGVIVLQVVLNIVSSNVRVRISGKIEMRLRKRVFSSLLKKEYEQFHRYHSGEIVNRLTGDIAHVVNGFTGLIPSAVSMLTKLLGGLIVLTRISPYFTAIILGLGGVVVLGSRFYGARLKKLHKKCQETDGKTRSFMQESLGNLLSIKAFSNQEYVEQRLMEHQRNNYRMRIKRNTISNIGNTAIYLVLTAAYYLALVWGVICLIAGTLSFGTLTALLQIFEQLKAPMRNASSLLPQYYAMLASAERLEELELLDEEEAALSADEQARLLNGFSFLCLYRISFAYEDDLPVLEEISFRLQRGEIVSLVGESGIGKSTLMKLLLSILKPLSGELYVQSGEERFPLTASTRPLFSYVPQGNTVLAGTLRENVAFFRENVSDERIWQALQHACLEEFISTLPDGLDTLLGEHGFDISEGQAQRIAIARALLNDAPVLLLDECTSALDLDTEKRLLDNIKHMTGKTVLMISHRNTTVQSADRILRIHDRHLTES
ncbi:MAG: ABC transporter ATP-binding protein [Clostridia bacterium]|nr:ABC transporter ATP-binding protein [Clostridia bacterium]